MHSNLLREITGVEISEYEDNGVVMLPGAFSLEWIESLRDATEVAMLNPGLHGEEYANLTRYYGVLVPNHRWRGLVTPAKRGKSV